MPVPERISDVISTWIDRSPLQPALVESSGTWSYQQLGKAVSETGEWLRSLGIQPGDRIMLLCENCRAAVAAVLAATAIDAWPVLVGTRLSAREVDEIRDHCQPRRIIYFTPVSPQAREHAKRHGASAMETASLGSLAVGPLDSRVEPEPLEPEISERVAALIYTSGTTGVAKGVMLTHRNLLFVASSSAKIRSLGPEDRLYGVLPITHAVGLSVVLIGSLMSGATLYLAPRFDPVAALGTIDKEKLTVVLGAPAMFALLVDYAKLRGVPSLAFRSLRIISSSGAPLEPATKTEVEKLFAMPLHNGYGVTECSPNISQAVVGEWRNDTSVGRVLPGVTIRLVGPERTQVPEGEVGELRVRGPNVMKGYYRAPELTADAFDQEGWFNTRDLARFENGYLFIEGRTKELIVRFGQNVYPAEVEAVFNTHPAVLHAAVIGRAVEGGEGGEEILAFLQLKPGATALEADLAQHAAQQLAPYKRPSRIFLLAEMPLTRTGKIVKAELEKLVASGSH
jgi:long-chain acyl-CoA synthetase